MAKYAELHCRSAYSFLRGANQPADLVARARDVGLTGLALTDIDGLYGVVQHAQAARTHGVNAIFGAEVTITGGHRLVVICRNQRDYSHLSRTLAYAHLAATKDTPMQVALTDLAAGGQFLILTGAGEGAEIPQLMARGQTEQAQRRLAQLQELFGRDNVAVEITLPGHPEDHRHASTLVELAAVRNAPVVATGNVDCACPSDFPVLTAQWANHRRTSLAAADPYLPASPAYIRTPQQVAHRFKRYPAAIDAAVQLAADCTFDFSLLAPELPDFPVPPGHSESTWLRELTYRGAYERYGPPDAEKAAGAYATIERELAIIEQLGFPGYFLIVHDIVQFCQREQILCQGRGSAANSAVCFALGITAVDAVRHRMLFERFLSPGRSGPPDIDIDVESGRREEVIQYVYQRYGRTHAALVANVITYRTRSAIRDAARALGYPSGHIDAMTRTVEHRHRPADGDQIPADVAELSGRLLRLPRHLGIHPGGMVICDRPVIDVCPVQWAPMPQRSIVQWDKDDCADAGLVKFDILGLGMLTALRIAFTELTARGVQVDGRPLGLHSIDQDDEEVYNLLCTADTVGVFQVESRAQMQTLPRLRPRCFYDIVIEVALVRPGPIQGGSVNPYIRRRLGKEPVTYLHPLLQPALEKTLGVPLFQEQLMQIAIDAAGFTPAQADQLRKAMGAKRSTERMEALRESLLAGMSERGIPPAAQEQIFHTLRGFAEFGFPESHAFSFAYLVYASAYLKVHYPEAFYAGLLAAQPMGFYSPQSLVADARRHGVTVRPASVATSRVEASVIDLPTPATSHREYDPACARRIHANPHQAVLLGLASIRGIGEAAAQRIVIAREQQPFSDVLDLARRARLNTNQIEYLASAGALADFGQRRQMLWLAAAAGRNAPARLGEGSRYEQLPLPGIDEPSALPELPEIDAVESSALDIWATGVSTTEHPLALVRSRLDAQQILTVADFLHLPDGQRARTAGVVTHRQRPATAAGITFLALEDETGVLNVVCSPGLWQAYRHTARNATALIIRGRCQKNDGAVCLQADQLQPLPLPVAATSRDFR